MKKMILIFALLVACLSPSVAVSADAVCLPNPSVMLCPTCPTTLQCYTVEDWLYFYFPWLYM